MKLSVEQFAHDVVACGLLRATELDPFKSALPNDKSGGDASGLAKKLVSAGKLTKYQAANALQGKAKNLVFGEYVVLAAIGAGGMGQVFKAEHRRMKRVVALKILPPSAVKSTASVQRFQREVQAAARLEHPNVVTAHDAGEANGVHFLVMQYVDGHDLASLVNEGGPLPPSKAINYILQAARGLAYAHGKGVIHRDVKPANLLLDEKGTIKILDLGLARLDGSLTPAPGANPTMTGYGDVMGTADYMAPEQAEDAHQADARADVYSLGCTLCFLLTAEAPYRGATLMQKMMAHREHPIPSLSQKRHQVPPALDQVFARMVAKRPADRLQTMHDVMTELAPLESPASGTVSPATETISAAANAPFAPTFPFSPQAKAAPTVPGDAPVTAGKPKLLKHDVVRKTWGATAKVTGALFATIIAPILVTFILKYLDKPSTDSRSPLPSNGGAPLITNKLPEQNEVSKQDEPVTIATPPKFVTGQPINLLKSIDLSRDVVSGTWEIHNGALQLPRTDQIHFSQIRLPGAAFSAYDVSLSLRRLQGATNTRGGVFFAIVVDDRYQAAVLMDSDAKELRLWGLELIDDKPVGANRTSVKVEPMFTTTPSRVLVKVRRGGVNVTCNDIPILDWRGRGEQLSLPKPCRIQAPPALYLVARAEFSFDDIRVTPGGGDWTALFNDRDLNGWTGADLTAWQADAHSDELTGTASQNNWLYTERDYRDFRLRFEFQMAAKTNSGVSLRGSPNDNQKDNLQIELCNDLALTKGTPTGAVNNAAFDASQGKHSPLQPLAAAKLKPPGSWNEFEAEMTGTRLRVWINGARLVDSDLKKAAEAKDAVPALKRPKGRIGLQISKGQVRFRNIVIHESKR